MIARIAMIVIPFPKYYAAHMAALENIIGCHMGLTRKSPFIRIMHFETERGLPRPD